MFLVTIEDKEDSIWWTDPSGFDSEAQAREFASMITTRKGQIPDGYEVVLYECFRRETLPVTP